MITTALFAARERAPYYARALAALTPVERPGLGTCGVDVAWRLYFDPAVLASWSAPERAAVMLHEVEHLLRGHHARAKEIAASGARWNWAADAEINDDVGGLPSGCVRAADAKMPDGLAAEEYLRKAPDAPDSCGSGSGGEALPGEIDAEDASVPGVSASQSEALIDAVAEDVRAAASRGDVPEHARMWAHARAEAARPKIPNWRGALAAWGSGHTTDWTWARLPRRGGDGPGRRRLASRPPALVLDASGSMVDRGPRVLAVVRAMLRRAPEGVWVYTHDAGATVRPPSRIRRLADLRVEGGGGTDLRPAIKAAMAAHGRVVVVTDGDTPWPSPWPTGLLALVCSDGMELEVRRAG